jgi:hypothetical protein
MGPEGLVSQGQAHLEILPDIQQDVLSNLGPVVDEDGFYLGGGTAVALHLGHRRSIDLDWFVAEDFGDPFRYASRLNDTGIKFEVRETARGTLHGTVERVKVSFLTYRYPLLESTASIAGFSCQMASLDDLACMKLAAAAQRGSKKDFIDIHAIIESGWTLPQMLSRYQSKYKVDDVGHVVMSLTYFDDAEREPMPMMLVDRDWETVKSTLREDVRAFAG